MAQDDIPGDRGAPGGPGSTRGSRGHQGVQGAPGGSRLPQAPKRVVIQQDKGPKLLSKAPRVCPDLKGMILIHFQDIYGHLGKLQQLHLVKMLNCQKPGLRKHFFAHLHRPPGVIFWWFRNFPHPQRCQEGVQNCPQKNESHICSEILLCILLCNFSKNQI